MRGADRAHEAVGRAALLFALASLALAAGCGGGGDGTTVAVPGAPGRTKSAALVRSSRRAYDGAPPVIPHQRFGPACVTCHTTAGMAVDGVGFAPAMPHGATSGLADTSRCTQCHVFRQTDDVFVATAFVGLAQDLRKGSRLYDGAPPVIPHQVFMRENCNACHSGPAAREEIRTTHPERENCVQCHAEAKTESVYRRP